MFFKLFICFSIVSKVVFSRDVWTQDQAWAWFNAQKPYIMGTEFTVSSAGNQLEMWQAETFDADLFDKELALGQKLGMTSMRIFLHDLAYSLDPTGFKNRMNITLGILEKYGMKPMWVMLAWGPIDNPTAGKQPKPLPALCNSGMDHYFSFD